MNRTINGMDFEEVLSELRKDFPPEDIKTHPYTGKRYITAEKIEARLNQVLGYGKWDFELSEPELWVLGAAKKECCTIRGRLIIFDDNRVGTVRSAPGAGDIIYPSGGDNPTSVANSAETAARDALKRCAKRFGIGVLDKSQRTVNSNNATNGENNKKMELYKVLVLEPFKAMSKGGARVAVKHENRNLDLIIWAKQWDEISHRYPGSFGINKKLNQLTFYGNEKTYCGKQQLEFIKFQEKGV